MSTYKEKIYDFVSAIIYSDSLNPEEMSVEEVYQKTVSLANRYGIDLNVHEEMYGTVKFFIYPTNAKRGAGYGYITPDTPIPGCPGCDVYVNSITLGKAGFISLPPGQRVAFTYRIDKTKKRPYAVRVRTISKEEDPKEKRAQQ